MSGARVLYHYANGETQVCGIGFGSYFEAEAHCVSIKQSIACGAIDMVDCSIEGDEPPPPKPVRKPWKCKLGWHVWSFPMMHYNDTVKEFMRVVWCVRCGKESER